MVGENKDQEKNNKGEEGKETPTGKEPLAGKETPSEQVITLTPQQYNALLDRMAELEDVALKRQKEVYSLDELAEEGRGGPTIPTQRGGGAQKEEEPKNLDDLSNTQLVNYIMDEGRKTLQVMDVKIETLRIMRELDKAERDHEDFWEYEKEVRKIATDNPTLSIEDAYVLAKQGRGPEKGEKGEKTPSDKRSILYSLPPRGIPSGEKPGVVPSSTKETQVKTLKEAANKAWEEVVGKGKIVIE